MSILKGGLGFKGEDANLPIITLTGTINLNANTSERLALNQCTVTDKTISYSFGLNFENTAVVCVMVGAKGGSEGSVANYSVGQIESTSPTEGSVGMSPKTESFEKPRALSLFNGHMTLRVGNFETTAQNGVPYKIVLIKTSG